MLSCGSSCCRMIFISVVLIKKCSLPCMSPRSIKAQSEIRLHNYMCVPEASSCGITIIDLATYYLTPSIPCSLTGFKVEKNACILMLL